MPKAEYLKLFTGDSSLMVALFTSDHGWIENIPAKQVFNGDAPEGLAYEHVHSIRELPATRLNTSFIAQYTDLPADSTATPAKPVPIGQIIINISNDMKISPAQSKAFTAELFKRIHNYLKAGRSLDSEFVYVDATDTPPSGWRIQFKQGQ
jgi:hypothetical protein